MMIADYLTERDGTAVAVRSSVPGELGGQR